MEGGRKEGRERQGGREAGREGGRARKVTLVSETAD